MPSLRTSRSRRRWAWRRRIGVPLLAQRRRLPLDAFPHLSAPPRSFGPRSAFYRGRAGGAGTHREFPRGVVLGPWARFWASTVCSFSSLPRCAPPGAWPPNPCDPTVHTSAAPAMNTWWSPHWFFPMRHPGQCSPTGHAPVYPAMGSGVPRLPVPRRRIRGGWALSSPLRPAHALARRVEAPRG